MPPDLAGAEGIIRDSRYVVGRSEDFGRELSAVRIFDDEIVIYRDAEGMAITLKDACSHHKLPLSRGTITEAAG